VWARESADLEEECGAEADGYGGTTSEASAYRYRGAERVYAWRCSPICEGKEKVEERRGRGMVDLTRGLGYLWRDGFDVRL
jgi:hypothetical protein